jgi:hypothetical protein
MRIRTAGRHRARHSENGMPKESIALRGGPMRFADDRDTHAHLGPHTQRIRIHVEKPRLISRRASTCLDADMVQSSRPRGIQQVGPHADARRIFRNHHFIAVLRNNRVTG